MSSSAFKDFSRPEAQAVNVRCVNTKRVTLARLASWRPAHSRLRRETGGEWRHLSGSLVVVREEGDRAISGGRGRAGR